MENTVFFRMKSNVFIVKKQCFHREKAMFSFRKSNVMPRDMPLFACQAAFYRLFPFYFVSIEKRTSQQDVFLCFEKYIFCKNE